MVNDVCTKLLNEFGIAAIPESFDEVYSIIAEKVSASKARGIERRIKHRYSNGVTDDYEFYRYKNSDYALSIILTCALNHRDIDQAAEYIENHSSSFGSEILEVGCDCGIMTYVLATLFPHAHITAVDRCAEGIEVAKRLIAEHNISNVTFICGDINDIACGEFDTVFSMRFIPENARPIKESNSDYWFDFNGNLAHYKEMLLPIAKTEAQLLKKGGTLITCEFFSVMFMQLAWFCALNAHGITTDLSSIEKHITMGEDIPAKTFYCSIASKNEVVPEIEFVEKCIPVFAGALKGEKFEGTDGDIYLRSCQLTLKEEWYMREGDDLACIYKIWRKTDIPRGFVFQQIHMLNVSKYTIYFRHHEVHEAYDHIHNDVAAWANMPDCKVEHNTY